MEFCDVGTALPALEVDLLCLGVHFGARLVTCRRLCHDGEHPSPVRLELGSFLARAAMEYAGAIHAFEPADHIAGARAGRVSAAGKDHANAPPLRKVDDVALQFAFRGTEQIMRELSAHHRQHRLRFGIAETAVELQYLRPCGREHEAEVKEPAIAQALLHESING